MENLMIFEGHKVEVFEFNGQVLFNKNNVAECLDISDVNSSIRNFNEKQIVKLKNSDMHNMPIRKLNNAGENFLTESGVYKLIFKSKKESAERFQDWVTDEVLPSIRQTGGYIPLSEEDTEQEILSKALSIMKNTLDKKDKLLKHQQKVIEEQEPLAEFGQALSKSKTSILIREMAKIITQSTGISIGEKKFYSWLRENKYIMQGSTEPYQRRVEQGLFERKANGTFTRSDGTTYTSYTTYVTPKGQQYFINKFLAERKVG